MSGSKHIVGAQRAQLAVEFQRRYDHGESIRELARTSGRSYGFVHRVLRERGQEFRGRGGPTRVGRRSPAGGAADAQD